MATLSGRSVFATTRHRTHLGDERAARREGARGARGPRDLLRGGGGRVVVRAVLLLLLLLDRVARGGLGAVVLHERERGEDAEDGAAPLLAAPPRHEREPPEEPPERVIAASGCRRRRAARHALRDRGRDEDQVLRRLLAERGVERAARPIELRGERAREREERAGLFEVLVVLAAAAGALGAARHVGRGDGRVRGHDAARAQALAGRAARKVDAKHAARGRAHPRVRVEEARAEPFRERRRSRADGRGAAAAAAVCARRQRAARGRRAAVRRERALERARCGLARNTRARLMLHRGPSLTSHK